MTINVHVESGEQKLTALYHPIKHEPPRGIKWIVCALLGTLHVFSWLRGFFFDRVEFHEKHKIYGFSYVNENNIKEANMFKWHRNACKRIFDCSARMSYELSMYEALTMKTMFSGSCYTSWTYYISVSKLRKRRRIEESHQLNFAFYRFHGWRFGDSQFNFHVNAYIHLTAHIFFDFGLSSGFSKRFSYFLLCIHALPFKNPISICTEHILWEFPYF